MGPSLTDWVEAVAREDRAAAEHLDFAPHRQRFLTYARRRRLRRKALGWASAGAVAASLVLVAYVTVATRPLTFAVAGHPGDVGASLVASERAALEVDFSDGSRLSLEQLAQARVLTLGDHSAHLKLERGAMQAKVVHADKTDWQVDAGPFRVSVVGTSFGVAWDPSSERFELELHEGSVAVSGPSLRTGCVVPAGGKLEVVLSSGSGSGSCVVSQPRDERKASREPEPSAPLSDSEPAHGAAANTGAASNAAPAPAAPDWRRLAALGKHEAAWEIVQALGFERVKSAAGAADLTLLANLARYSGEPARARAALNEVRQRFPQSSDAAHAAFLLGRLAADQEQAPAEGARWFSTYLNERPGGPFAAEALGRLLDCQIKAGQRSQARSTAQSYLERYPAGSYSSLARQVLDKAE